MKSWISALSSTPVGPPPTTTMWSSRARSSAETPGKDAAWTLRTCSSGDGGEGRGGPGRREGRGGALTHEREADGAGVRELLQPAGQQRLRPSTCLPPGQPAPYLEVVGVLLDAGDAERVVARSDGDGEPGVRDGDAGHRIGSQSASVERGITHTSNGMVVDRGGVL